MPLSSLPTSKNNSIPLRDKVYLALKKAIVSGQIKRLQRLIEPDIARMFGVSRTPVREAIFQLEKEGLVSIIHNKGALVNSISIKDIDEIYTIVGALEGIAAALAVPYVLPKDTARMKQLNARLKTPECQASPQKYLRYDVLFHSAYVRKCRNRRLLRIVLSELESIYSYRVLSHSNPERLRGSIKAHESIIRAFELRDPLRVRRVVEAHILKGGAILKERLQKIFL